MDFREKLSIYVQIAERLKDEIIAGKYGVDERVPGVREYSVLLQVNVNTTTKAFDLLRQHGIIYDKRGLGCFVSEHARDIILDERRNDFFKNQIPELAKKMQQLGINQEQLIEHLNQADSQE